MNYKKFDYVFTYDDYMFENNILIPQSLSINQYNEFKYDKNYLKSFIKKKPDREEKELENIFIFIFNRGKQSGGNYFHFHFHYLQKLIGYFELNDVKLGIPLNMLPFQSFMIKKMVPEENIIYLDIYKYNYNIKNCYVGDYESSFMIPNILLDKFREISDDYIKDNNLTSFILSEKQNNVVIYRENDKKNAGQNRYIVNNDEYNILLDCYDFKRLTFDNLSLEDKIIKFIYFKPKIVIIEIGSGLTNLLFIPKDFLKDIHFIILDQYNWFLKKSRIYDIINKLELKHSIITNKNVVDNTSDLQNNPFIVEIDLLDHKINQLIDEIA